MARVRKWNLHLLSDSTGSLPAHMVNAVTTQFEGVTIEKHQHPFADTPEKVKAAIGKLGRGRHMVLHALVQPESKQVVREVCDAGKVPHLDLTGPLVAFLSEHLATEPLNQLSRLHPTDSTYFRRIDAMEFTAEHDDGHGLDTLDQADIVIVGLSRVSKSPTATYLGSWGYKAANVSIAPETGIPRQLAALKRKIVVALSAQPKHLAQIRAQRWDEDHVEGMAYANLRDVIRETVWAEGEYRKRGWPILDTTGMTIEKTSAKIVELLNVPRKL